MTDTPRKPPPHSPTSHSCPICHAALSSSPDLTLSCRHTFHRTCIKQQLLHARPDPSQALNLTPYNCPVCRTFCDHPDLTHLTEQPRRLLKDIQHVLHRAQSHAPARTGAPSLNHHVDDHSPPALAVYLCHVCLDPFVGGTIHCVNELARYRLPVDERVCHTCVLNDNTTLPAVCTDPTHADAHVWKCRLCCAPADTVYFARTHLCNACENRFKRDTRCLPIPCDGATTCRYPLPDGQLSHFNHSSTRGELLYFCAVCQTTPKGLVPHPEDDDCSHNLIFNPSGALATAGWTHITTQDRWVAEPSTLSVDEQQATNFVSTWTTCIMAQVVDLKQHVTHPTAETLAITARFRGHEAHESHYTLQASLLDNTCEELSHVTTGDTKTQREWMTERLTLSPDSNARFALLAIRGIDDSCTRGTFGSKASVLSMTVALRGRDARDVMTGAEIVDTSGEEWTEVAVHTFCERRRRDRMEAEAGRVQRARDRVARRDALLPEPEPEQIEGYDSEESGRDPEEVRKEFDYPTSE